MASEAKLASLLQARRNYQRRKGYEEEYRTRAQEDRPEKLITVPRRELQRIQKRIHLLLSRIITPDYLFSGVKGRSNIGNAAVHQNAAYVVTMDISQFYESCDGAFIFRFWHKSFQMPADLALQLTKICTYSCHIPRGSSHSQLTAYWAFKKMFDRIEKLSSQRGCRFSLFVDDMAFSSAKPIPDRFYFEINSIVKAYGLRLKRSKLKSYTRRNPKLVTGCIIHHGKLCVPNRRTKEIVDRLKSLKENKTPTPEKLDSLIGRVSSARQIEPEIFSATLARLRHLKRDLSQETA